MDNSLIILVLIIIIMILCTFSNKSENFDNNTSYQIVGIDERTSDKDNITLDFNKDPMILTNKTIIYQNTGEKAFSDFLSTYVLPDNIGKVWYNGNYYKGIKIYVVPEDREPVYLIGFDLNSKPIP